MIHAILFGPQASGKGTQSKLLAEALGIPAISTGEMFREQIKRGTGLGKEAEAYMNRGELVPDELTNAIVRDRLSRDDVKKGYVFDGFPRNAVQADALDSLSTINLTLVLTLSDNEIVRRLSGRRVCPNDHIYHTEYKPPRQAGVCDIDGLPLSQRDDETPEAIRVRLRIYRERTTPLIDRYRKQGIPILEIDGSPSIEDVHASVMKAVEAYR